jgi:hypothetical protein
MAGFPIFPGKPPLRRPGGGSDFEVDIKNILDNLEFTLMGIVDVRKGRWGLLTDGDLHGCGGFGNRYA